MKINVLGRAEVASGPGAQTKGRNGAARVSAPPACRTVGRIKQAAGPFRGWGEERLGS